MKMKKRICATTLCLCLLATIVQLPTVTHTVSAQEVQTRTEGRDYYISSQNGSDSKDASSMDEAWATLGNLANVQLEPGDRILLEAGSIFNGFIQIKDTSGTKENPIQITKYGEGNRPVINANGEGIWYQDYGQGLDNAGHRNKGYVSSAILLYDVDFIEVRDLEITNTVDDYKNNLENPLRDRMDRTGVAGIAQNGGVMEHIYLDNLYIHDVSGNLQDKHMNNGGIQMNALKPKEEATSGPARYVDVKITNNYIEKVSRAGIVVGYTYNHNRFASAEISDEVAQKYGHTDILIENNYVKDAGNDAIVAMYAYRPMIRNNVADGAGADLDDHHENYWQSFCAGIWPWKTKDAIFEYNEAFDTVGEGNGDGQAWDIDWSDGTIYQYNYSHNNGGGSMLICLDQAINGTFRYNVSQNDLKTLVTFQGNPLAKIYNNVFYIDGDLSTNVHHPDAGKRSGEGYLANNIFYNISTGRVKEEWNPNGNKTFTNNLYYGYDGNIPNDAAAITSDPKFFKPGSGPIQPLSTLASEKDKVTHDTSVFEGYKIADDSPAVNAGIYIPGHAEFDFFGNLIGLLPDIGIFETSVKEDVQQIFSNVYDIKEDSIEKIKKGTKVVEFKKNIKSSAGTQLRVSGKDEEDFIVDGDILNVTFTDTTTKVFTLKVDKSYIEYDPLHMSATDGNHETSSATEGAAKFTLDNNMNTLWHSSWNGCARSETWMELDLKDVKPVAMLNYTPRKNIGPGGKNGTITKYQILTKKEANDEWSLASEGTWELNESKKFANFETVDARYVRLVALDSYSNGNNIYVSAAEVRVGYEVE